MVAIPAVENAGARPAAVGIAVLVEIDEFVQSAKVDGSGKKERQTNWIHVRAFLWEKLIRQIKKYEAFVFTGLIK